MKLLRETLESEFSLSKHKANKHSTRKTIGCFAETFGCLYQFTNIKLKLKSLRIERMHTEIYTGSLLTKSYTQSSQKPLGNPLSNQPRLLTTQPKKWPWSPQDTHFLWSNTTPLRMLILIPSRTHNTSQLYTQSFFQSTKDYTCYRKDMKSVQHENPISHSLINAISKQFSTFQKAHSVKKSNLFFLWLKQSFFVA